MEYKKGSENMDDKIYMVLKTLYEEDRIPTTEEIGMNDYQYKIFLGKIQGDGYISNLHFNVNKCHAEIEISGIEYINEYKK